MSRRRLRIGYRFAALFRNPLFWVLTLGGNSIVFVGSIVLYYFESDSQSPRIDFIDYLLWSMGTVTTIGYGSFMPVTFPGKIALLFLMAAGTLFVWSYMAFLVTGLLAPELATLEREVQDVEKDVEEVEKEIKELKIK